MSVPPEQFSRIGGSIDVQRLRGQLVVMVGVGTVGSQIADDLARSGVGRFRFIDGDVLERPNLARHALTERHVGRNKAEALTEFLADELNVPGGEAVPHDITEEVSDGELDALLADADLIVAATDREAVQRRVARRALALDIPAVLPALYEQGGGEVVVQLSPAFPCFLCWAAHRTEGEPLRRVGALNVQALGINELATWLCLGLLDPSSQFQEILRPEPGQGQPQLFVRNQMRMTMRPIQRRPGCPSCAVGPARPEGSGEPPAPPAGEWGRPFDAATGAVAPWAFFLGLGGFCAALVLAFLAAHSFQVYDKSGYAYGHALWFLLQTFALAGLPVVAGLWAWELLRQREQARLPRYAAELVAREDYRRTVLLATVGPATFLYLFHGFGPVTPPPWWWLVPPLSVCIAHVGFLTWDRLQDDPASDGYWIGGTALAALLAAALIVGFPDTSIGSPPEATAAQQAEPSESAEEHEAEARAHREREALEEEAEDREPPEVFYPCEPWAPALGVSAYRCTPGEMEIQTEFFAASNDAEEALFDRATEVEASESDATCPNEAPAVERFHLEEQGESMDGYLLCFIESGQWHFDWTDTFSFENRFSEATFPTPSARAARQWWEPSDKEAWRQLPVERVPPRYGPCEAAYPEGEAAEAVACLANGVDTRLQFFEDWRQAQSYLRERAVEASPRPDGRCAEAVPALERFTYRDPEGQRSNGRLLCFVNGGRLVYDWIKPDLRLVGEAEFQSADPQPAESWWRGR